MPALAHTMSRPPCRSTAVATTRRQSSGLVTSAVTPLTVAVECTQVGDGGVDVGLGAPGDHHVDTGGGERLGDAATDTLAAAGDDGRTALQ